MKLLRCLEILVGDEVIDTNCCDVTIAAVL